MRRDLACALLLALCGCAAGPDFTRPDAPKTSGYLPGDSTRQPGSIGQGPQAFQPGLRQTADWWRMFGSAKLDSLIARALENNPTIASAQAALEQSQASLRAGAGIFFPQLTGGASGERQQYNPSRVGEPLPPTVFNLFTLSASVSYTLDLFGGERRAVEKLAAQVDVQRYTALAASLMLEGNVANTAIAQAGYREQVKAIRELLELEKQQVQIAEVQVRAGTQPASTLLALQSAAASTEAELPPLEQRVDAASHLLAVLGGEFPAEWKEPQLALAELQLPKDLPLSLPSELVQQRPDVLIAEATLHASSAEIGVATAALFPSITLSAGAGLGNGTIGALTGSKSAFWNFGAGLTAPLFDGGTLWFQRRAALAAYRQSAANYRETVLAAFEQVADDLRALEHDADELDAQNRALGAAQQSLDLIQINYQSGVATYLQVLAADAQLHQARLGVIQAQTQRLQDTAALYAALGGGWWNAAAVSDAKN